MSTSVSERERLEALASCNILDTAPEEAFERVARLMDACFGVPAATVAFVGAHRTWGEAYTGFDPSIEREDSFCLHVVVNDEALVLEAPHRDPRFANNPMVVGEPGVRFYAGAPVHAPNDIPIGTVCLYDTTSRSFSSEELDRLQDFARLVEDQIANRESASEAASYEAQGKGDPPRPTEGVLRLKPDGRAEWANDHLVEMTGYTREELQGTYPDRLLYGPGTDDDAIEAINRHLSRRESFFESILLYRKSGTQYWVQVEGTPLFDDGACTGFRLRLSDVTEARQRADSVKALTSFYEEVLQELPVEIAVMDPAGRYLFLNPASVGDDEMREWLIGKTALDYAEARGLDPAPFRKRMNTIRRVVRTNEPDSFEDSVPKDDGTTRYIHRVAYPVTNEEGEVIRVFGYGIDVTERKMREQNLRQAKEHAEEMNRLKTTFLANMSHEIRTPLTSIIGFAEVLADSVDGEQQEMADLIRRSGSRLQETLTSVLELARLEGENRSLAPERLDLIDRIRTTTELLRPRVAEDDVTLTVDLPSAPVEARIDGTALDRIYTNLLANAIKFTETGEITVSLDATADTIEIVVSDTGCGIDDSFQQQIYEAFKQESSGMARTHEGIGLGLTIISRLVDLMDGAIDIDSEKGVGTTVTVQLPRFTHADAEQPAKM